MSHCSSDFHGARPFPRVLRVLHYVNCIKSAAAGCAPRGGLEPPLTCTFVTGSHLPELISKLSVAPVLRTFRGSKSGGRLGFRPTTLTAESAAPRVGARLSGLSFLHHSTTGYGCVMGARLSRLSSHLSLTQASNLRENCKYLGTSMYFVGIFMSVISPDRGKAPRRACSTLH